MSLFRRLFHRGNRATVEPEAARCDICGISGGMHLHNNVFIEDGVRYPMSEYPPRSEWIYPSPVEERAWE